MDQINGIKSMQQSIIYIYNQKKHTILILILSFITSLPTPTLTSFTLGILTKLGSGKLENVASPKSNKCNTSFGSFSFSLLP